MSKDKSDKSNQPKHSNKVDKSDKIDKSLTGLDQILFPQSSGSNQNQSGGKNPSDGDK